MRKTKCSIVSLIISGLVLMAGCSKKQQSAEIISYGITDNITVETQTRHNAMLGYDGLYDGWRVLKKTSQIPLVKNVQFGIEYIIHGSPKGHVTIEEVIIFPESGLIDPVSGNIRTDDRMKRKVQLNESNSFCYRLESREEMLPGLWIFQVRYKDSVLAEKTFVVHDGGGDR